MVAVLVHWSAVRKHCVDTYISPTTTHTYYHHYTRARSRRYKPTKNIPIMVKHILVIECTPQLNWYEIFEGARHHGIEAVSVEQAVWQDVSLTAYSDAGVVVSLRAAKNPLPNTPQNTNRTIRPDLGMLSCLSASLPLASRILIFLAVFVDQSRTFVFKIDIDVTVTVTCDCE
jgi:Synapsin, N-terminal domain